MAESKSKSKALPLRWTYNGPRARAGVTILLPTGRRLTVERGDTIEVMPIEAEALSKLVTSWTPAKAPAASDLGGHTE